MAEYSKQTINGVSALICTYNGANRLPETLKCLLLQKFDYKINWEVILIDNASTDNTKEVAKKTWNHPETSLNIYTEIRPGKPNALETGFEKANYDIVCIIDDDNRVYTDYISKIYKIMNTHSEVGMCGAHGIGDFEVKPPEWFQKFQDGYAIGPQAKQSGYIDLEHGYLYGAGCAVRKKAWFELKQKGFKFLIEGRIGKNVVGGGEDYEMSIALLMMGYKLWYQDDIRFKHFMPANRVSWKYVKKLFFSFGISSVITDIYAFFIKTQSKQRKIRLKHYYINICYTLFIYIVKLPNYVYFTLFKNTGNKYILDFKRIQGYMFFLLSIRKKYKILFAELKTAKWRKGNNLQ